MVSPGFGASGFVMQRSYLNADGGSVSRLTVGFGKPLQAPRPQAGLSVRGTPVGVSEEVLHISRDGMRATVKHTRCRCTLDRRKTNGGVTADASPMAKARDTG